MDYLQKELARLAKLTKSIEESGPIAPLNCWVDIQKPSGRKVTYARKRSKLAMFPGEKKVQGLGPVGSDEHQAFELEIARRNALEEIKRRTKALQKMVDNPLWEPGAPPLELDQTEYVPPGTVATGKPAAHKPPKLSRFCPGQTVTIGKNDDVPELAALAGRDGVVSEVNKSGSILTVEVEGEKVKVMPSELLLPTAPTSKPDTKKSRKPATLTHMKTKAGSRVHAIKGELNGDKRSYKAALCGAKPPGNTLGWEIPGVDPHIVSCPKCFKRLPADYTRHIPKL